MMNKVMNQTVTKQGGLTLISWLVIIIFLLFQGIILMKVVPVYMTDASVGSIMKELTVSIALNPIILKSVKDAVKGSLLSNISRVVILSPILIIL